MLKEIYVARDADGSIWQFSQKPELDGNVFRNNGRGTYVKDNAFDISLKPLECVKVIIDTLNQSYRIDKVPTREDGWYYIKTELGKEGVCKWENSTQRFYDMGRCNQYTDDYVTVLSGKLYPEKS